MTDERCEVTATPPSSPPLAESKPTTTAATPEYRTSSDDVVEATPETLPDTEAFIYAQRGDDPMRLFVMKPKDWKAGQRRPALVFFFGGGWTKGTPEKSVTWAKFAASLGMVGVAPDYRTKNRFGTSPLESVADARAAVRWVQDHAGELGVDPAKIIVGGNSAGGHLALWTAISAPPPGSITAESPKPKPAALLLFSAVSDTTPLTGYTPQRFGAHTLALSPIHQLDADMPPMLVFHGDADPTVPHAQAVALNEKLKAGGTLCEFVTVPGGNHGFSSQFPEWKDKSRCMTPTSAVPAAGGPLPPRWRGC